MSNDHQVPLVTMAVCGFLSAIVALLFDIEKLVEFMSIGTLMAYTIVSAAVIILRYRPVAKTETLPLAETPATSPVDELSQVTLTDLMACQTDLYRSIVLTTLRNLTRM